MRGLKTWQKIVIGSTVLALVVAVPAAMAAGRHFRGHMMKRIIEQRIANAEDLIDATPQQRATIDEAKASIIAKFQAHAQARGEKRDQWIDLLSADNLDAQRIYSEADARAEEIKAMAREIVPEIQKVHDALTPAQRQKLAAHAKDMHHRMERFEKGE
ncbi:MAG: Spy/CpxP family protein refolding chaperone [Deltaproteobacteria bacterium]|nr:Spy/CpxP family protein refolding chaperone [Deltaproteobacteria bacterium]